MNCKEEDKEFIKNLINKQCDKEHEIDFYNVQPKQDNILHLEKY